MRTAAVFEEGRGAKAKERQREREKKEALSSLAREYFFSHRTSSHLFSSSVSPLCPPLLNPFPNLTADAHCSGKLGLDGKPSKCTTRPKAASCGLRVHISLSVFIFAVLFPRIGGQRSPAGWNTIKSTY